MPRASGQDARGWIGRALVAVGLACLAWVGFAWVQTHLYQERARAWLNEAARSGPPPVVDARPDPVVGILEIPRLGYSEAVAEGDDDGTLKVAIGHLPDTVPPWRPGNAAFAGHRDTLFRSLRAIRVGDELRILTTHGDFAYRVHDTLIVDPEDVWVVAPTYERRLTLITCYPFTYIGSAPHRFIVRADPIDEDESSAGQAVAAAGVASLSALLAPAPPPRRVP